MCLILSTNSTDTQCCVTLCDCHTTSQFVPSPANSRHIRMLTELLPSALPRLLQTACLALVDGQCFWSTQCRLRYSCYSVMYLFSSAQLLSLLDFQVILKWMLFTRPCKVRSLPVFNNHMPGAHLSIFIQHDNLEQRDNCKKLVKFAFLISSHLKLCGTYNQK